MNNEHHETLATLSAKVGPPVAVSSAAAYGIQLSDITLILTIIYTSVQLYITVRNLLRERKQKKEDKNE